MSLHVHHSPISQVSKFVVMLQLRFVFLHVCETNKELKVCALRLSSSYKCARDFPYAVYVFVSSSERRTSMISY